MTDVPAELVAEFAAAHPEWGTAEGARGQCSRASGAFLDLLLEHDVIDRAGQFRGEWDNEEHLVADGVSHHVARVGRSRFDWTARQFDPETNFPLVVEV